MSFAPYSSPQQADFTPSYFRNTEPIPEEREPPSGGPYVHFRERNPQQQAEFEEMLKIELQNRDNRVPHNHPPTPQYLPGYDPFRSDHVDMAEGWQKDKPPEQTSDTPDRDRPQLESRWKEYRKKWPSYEPAPNETTHQFQNRRNMECEQIRDPGMMGSVQWDNVQRMYIADLSSLTPRNLEQQVRQHYRLLMNNLRPAHYQFLPTPPLIPTPVIQQSFTLKDSSYCYLPSGTNVQYAQNETGLAVAQFVALDAMEFTRFGHHQEHGYSKYTLPLSGTTFTPT